MSKLIQKNKNELHDEDIYEGNEDIRDLLPLSQDEKVEERGWELDLNELYAPNGKYTPEEKLYAVVCFMVEGNSVKASARCGINAATIRWWKTESVWWDSAMRESRRRYQDMLDGKLTAVIHDATSEIADRVEYGDTVITKDGDEILKPMTGRDLATTMAILYDKRALLRGDPTSNPGRGNAGELDALTKKFEDFANKMEKSGNMAKPIQGEVVTGASILGKEKD